MRSVLSTVRTRAAVVCGVGGLLVVASSGLSTSSAAAGSAVEHRAASSASERQEVASYWSPSRMRQADSVEPQLGLDAKQTASSAPEIARGAPTIVRPTVPRVGPLPRVIPESGGPWTGGGAVTSTGGRVFFTFQGQDASCSGDAVTSANKSVVITAGHCVKYEGSWHTNWVFVPGYDNGSAPLGTWTATSTLTTPQWEATEDINYDVGAAVVAPVGGRALTDAVGGQGIAFNQARGQATYAFGYPAADPYDGETLIYCSGTTFDDLFGTNDQGLSCDMTGGSSGGPWFLEFDEASGAGIQNSVNSFGYVFLPDTMFGPYFGSEAQAVYDQAQAG